MELHARVQGRGSPLILLHGLFGSNENLGGIARALSDRFTLYGLDLRNHGRSPHAERMDYPAMADDVRATMDARGLASAAVLGHSLGGKTAMELALAQPDRVERLIVVDIAPVSYARAHNDELDAMRSLDLGAMRSRADADRGLAARIEAPALRQFLLKNLVRSDGGLAWRIPLETIADQYPSIAAAPSSAGPYEGPTLFIRGGNSSYVPPEAEPAIRSRFPKARVETIPGAAHWVHVDAAATFVEVVGTFLEAASRESRTGAHRRP